jgi:hypothetical protein
MDYENPARVEFKCNSAKYRDGLFVRDFDCYERQIAQQAAEIERLKTASATMAGMVLKAALDEREACAKVCESHVCTSDCSAYGLGSNCEFVISAEIRARGEVK